MSKQWEDTSDLLTVHRDVRVALCYDFKRRPVEPDRFRRPHPVRDRAVADAG